MDILTAHIIRIDGMKAITCLFFIALFFVRYCRHHIQGQAFTLPAPGVGKGQAMTANERRKQILYYLSDYRKTTYVELKEHFQVGYNTIRRDIEQLTCEYPITVTPGMYGGITVPENWRYDRRYLNDHQEELLRRICKNLDGEDKETMESILRAFSKKQNKI